MLLFAFKHLDYLLFFLFDVAAFYFLLHFLWRHQTNGNLVQGKGHLLPFGTESILQEQYFPAVGCQDSNLQKRFRNTIFGNLPVWMLRSLVSGCDYSQRHNPSVHMSPSLEATARRDPPYAVILKPYLEHVWDYHEGKY